MLDKRPSLIVLFAAAAVLAAVIFAADLNLPLGVAGGVPYVAVVLLGWWLPKRRYIFALAAMCTALTVAGHFITMADGMTGVVVVNHGLALFAIWIVAALLFMAKTELRAREKSQESEQRFRDLAEAASDWFWEMGPDLRFTYFSEGFFAISGVEPEAALGKTRREVAAAQEDPAKWEAHLEDLDRRRPFRDFVYEIVLGDNATRHIKISGKPVFTERGHFMGYRGTGSNVTAQVEAEKRARDAEYKLAGAIEGLSDGAVLYDADERLVICNSKYLESRREVEDHCVPGTLFEDHIRARAGRGGIEGVDADDPEQVEKWVRKRLDWFRNPGPAHVRPLSSGQWESVRDYKTRDGGTFIILTDVTERKRAEDALRESEERLSTIFEASPIGIAIVSTETNKRLYVNPAMVELFGAASAEQLLAHDLATTYVDPADLKRLRAGEGDDFIAEMEIERKRLDGTTWWCLLNRRMIDYEGQKALMALHYDISGRKNTEEALRESELRFRDLAETASDWFWEMDPDFRFTYVSEKFFEVTKFKHEDIIGKTRQKTADPISQDEDPDAWARHQEDLEARRPFSNFVRSFPGRSGTPYEGKRIYVRLNGRPRFDEKGEFLGYRGTATDITREIETEKALRENELRLKAIIDTVPAIVNVKDTDGRYILSNRNHAEFFGLDREKIIGKRSTVLSRKHSRKTREMERAIVESGEALPAYEIKAKDAPGRTKSWRGPARALYTGSVFRSRRDYFEDSDTPYFIVSAKHGLVDPSQPLGKYCEPMPSSLSIRTAKAQGVVEQLQRKLG
ncbi:MAG: PAS domain S-box protein, partial [Proteobacteria bacterium]|nr:PAS domain S-box protein [Pseudomonadota bacterium]